MIVQSVRFRLRPGSSRGGFLALSARAGWEFLAVQPGFLGRELFEEPDGAWRGLLRWRDPASRDAAGARWAQHPLAHALGELTEPDSLTIADLSLRHRDPPALPASPPRCGAIHWLSTHEPGGAGLDLPHPHVVIQGEVLNRSRIPTVTVCALTSNPNRATEPGNVLLDPGEGGLDKRSVVVVSQVSTVPKAILGEAVGTLSGHRIDQILTGLAFLQSSGFTR